MERKEPKKNVHVHMANVILQIHKITQQKPFFSTDHAHSHCSFWEQARCGDQNRLLRFSSRAVVNPLDPFKGNSNTHVFEQNI